MLINQIHTHMMNARKGTDTVAKNLLVTLYSEAARVGKDKRNGESTDEEVLAMIKKFISNTQETMRLLEERGQSAHVQAQELDILTAYLPTQMTSDQLRMAIAQIVSEQPERNVKIMGKVMAELKMRHGASYDARMASELVKSALS
jgi:uncharacterized protein YqeY